MHTYLQVAQTSALTDRQGEERRILNLENAVKSVSRDISFNRFRYLNLPALSLSLSHDCM